MLRKIRRTLAVLFFACITLLFLDFTGTLHAWLGWMARVQFLPAVLALNVGVMAALAVLTLLFGRVYCSVVCPLGVFQDLVDWLGGRGKRRKYRFSYSPARRWLRCGTLALFVAALVAGVGSLVALLAPYSAYGRIASNFFRPVYLWGNNALAAVAERVGSYAFYETEVRVAGLPTLLIAAATCAVLVVLAWRNGRTYCNTVCPVGTVLGFLSKYALFRPVIDPEKCRDCGLCARGCKAACIDYRNRRIDYSRCVACMDCLDVCRHGAVGYRFRTKTAASVPGAAAGKRTESAAPADTGRRNFLTGTGLLLRTRLLPPRVHEVLRGLPRRSHPPRHGGREVRGSDRPCRLGAGELRTAHRRCGVRQLRPPLPVGGHHDGTVRHRRSRLAEDSDRQHRALHRLRRLRKPLSGTPVQRDLRRRARTPPNHLTPETHGDQR